MCVYIYIYTHAYYIYIYIYRERESGQPEALPPLRQCVAPLSSWCTWHQWTSGPANASQAPCSAQPNLRHSFAFNFTMMQSVPLTFPRSLCTVFVWLPMPTCSRLPAVDDNCELDSSWCLSADGDMYIYIYIYIYRERDIDREIDREIDKEIER